MGMLSAYSEAEAMLLLKQTVNATAVFPEAGTVYPIKAT